MDKKLKNKGLFKRYKVSKADGSKADPNAKYFVMRYDHAANDPIHRDACRKAILRYAELIRDHLPELGSDLEKAISGERIKDD